MAKIGVSAALVVVLAAGCGSITGAAREGGDASPGAQWDPPAHYAFDVAAGCGFRTGLIGTHRITVVRDEPVAIEPIEGSARVRLVDALTIPDIVQRARTARQAGADRVVVSRSSAGVPTRVSIDYLRDAVDDEECYRISHVVTTPGSASATTQDSASGEEPPEPTYTWNDQPSPVVLLLPSSNVELRPWAYCWTGPPRRSGLSSAVCPNGAPENPAQLDAVGPAEAVDFWFGMPGWDFEAAFSEIGPACPRRHTIDATATSDRTFHLQPAGPAGRYQVDLFGRGGTGSVSASFVWTTPRAGPIEQPEAYIALVTDSGDRLTSYGLEVGVSDLGFQPRRADVRVTATAANGRSTTLDATREGHGDECSEQGAVFFHGDDSSAHKVARLGPAPFTYRVVLSLNGDEYIGTGVWPRDEQPDQAPNTTLTFDPPLPPYEVTHPTGRQVLQAG
jgi:hypothetical protein